MIMMRFFTSDLRRNLIKIVCLTLGMSIGFLLIAKAYLEETYDTFHPGHEQLYLLTESVTMNGEYREYDKTAGAIAPGIKRYSPLVESATRYTYLHSDMRLMTSDRKYHRAQNVLMADSCFFDVFRTEILAGDPHEALSVVNSIMIPQSLAEQLGPDAMGMELQAPDWLPDIKFTVRGIYKDFPLNTVLSNGVYLSLSSIGQFTYDGRDNWIGNDRYVSFVRLTAGADPKDLQPHVSKMLTGNIDSEDLEMTHYNIGTKPITDIHSSNDSVRTMIWILTLLAVILLMSAGLNYLLITIGQMGKRAKEMAVRKCYGTSNLKIFGIVMGESLFFLTVSMALAILIAMCLSDACMRLLGHTAGELLTTGQVWMVEVAVCLGLLIVTGVIPAWMYCRTPVAHSFRVKVCSRRLWKLALLSIQFIASGFLTCMLVLVGRQYAHVSSTDMGLEYQQLGYINLGGVPQVQRPVLKEELGRLGCVEGVSTNDRDLTDWGSGNNVWTTDWEKEVNVADMYFANPDLFDVAGVKITEGTTFSAEADSTVNEVMVEETFRDVWEKIDGPLAEGEGLVGKRFYITEHSGDDRKEFTICGVFGKMQRGGVQDDNADKRAAVMFPAKSVRNNMYIRFSELTPENLTAAQEVVKRVLPDKDIYITPYKDKIEARTADVRNFGLSVMIIGIVIILIAMIGLVGYTSDEVQRRAKEVAIRKVTGSPASQIVRMFVIDIMKVAVPSLIVGGSLAMIVGRRWLSQFTYQVELSPLADVTCLLCLFVILVAVVALNTLSVARSNPVDSFRDE